ncbi:MAG: hypothetical protein JNK82_33125 [Myxococcaceae bacterium]|nr:hypothetical protein [Myxococcaceae bacterium]
MKVVVLAIAVGGLAGIGLGERDVPFAPDPWLAEAIRGIRSGDLLRADRAIYWRRQLAPDDAAAKVMERYVSAAVECERATRQLESAFVRHDRAAAASAYARLDDGCRAHGYAQARLRQLGDLD